VQTTNLQVSDVDVRVQSYRDTLSFTVTPIKGYDAIFGKPWLTAHNPVIDWSSNTITSPFLLVGDLAPQPEVRLQIVKAKKMLKDIRNGTSTIFMATIQELQATMATAESQSRSEPESTDVDPFRPENTCLSPANIEALHSILDTYRESFSKPTSVPTTGPLHKIDLKPGSQPTHQHLRRMSPAELAEVQRQLEEYLSNGWIRPSTSEYGAGIVFARKPDGSLRMCVDYRALNAITVKDRYPLPHINELLDQLHGAAYFTSLDLWSGFHQVRIAPEDVHKTAFNTRYGSYEFTVMPFAMTNSPSAFMRLMNNTLKPFLDKFVVVYIDDVLIYSKTESEHLKHIELVLSTLKSANLRLKISKCSFAQPSTKFLGFFINDKGLHVDPAKVSAVVSWAPPNDITSVRAFLGFTGFYRRFIKDYAKIAAPLTDLTKTTVPFPRQLPQDAVTAFLGLQAALTSAPLLVIPQTGPDATFQLYTDASGVGVGAVLLQDQGDGPQPVCYESRKFAPTEKNYPVHEQELLAVVHAVKTFRHYLEGCKHFTLYTDHHSLKFFFTQKDLSKRQARWAEELSTYQPNMEIVYRPGKENQADALSRIFSLSSAGALNMFLMVTDAVPNHIVLDDSIHQNIRSAYQSDPYYSDGNTSRPPYLRCDQGYWYFKNRLCVPRDSGIRAKILYEFHDAPSAGHQGFLKTFNALSSHFWWPHLVRTVKAYIASCATCQRIKPSTLCPPGLLQPHDIPPRPWSHVSLDLVTDLPKSLCHNGMHYDSVITFVCMLTKQCFLVRANKTITARQLAHIFIDNIYSKKGLPSLLVSDRDPRFTSEFWKSLFSQLGTKLNLSMSHHPQTDGQTERTHRSIEQILRAYVHPNHDDWSNWLPFVEFAYNSSIHSSTHQSPFYANYGFNPTTPASLLNPDPDSSSSDFLENIEQVQTCIKRELELAKAQQAAQADKHRRPLSFSVGDRVRLSTDYITLLNQPSAKLRHRFLGPFKVLEVVSPVSYRLELPASMRVHPVFHVSRLLPWIETPPDLPTRQIPDQQIPSAKDYVYGEAYEAHSITDAKIMVDPASRVKALSLFFRVKWSPPYHDPSHDTWEPYKNVKRLTVMKDFLKSHQWQAFSATEEYKTFARKYRQSSKIPKVQ
jgi:hypothetical protein